jgi:cytochrome c peroxidase
MAGQRFLGFLPDEEVQEALMEFIGNPRRAPNPFAEADPELLARGERVFYRARCDVCHPPPTYTDLKKHDVGLSGYTSEVDFRTRFDTPSLLECYRTGPYLHDGRAETLRALFREHNPENAHGLTGGLTEVELDELIAFLRSL